MFNYHPMSPKFTAKEEKKKKKKKKKKPNSWLLVCGIHKYKAK